MSRTFNLGDHIDRRVVLAGAGLSRNWGGYLVSEIWGAILSHPEVQEYEPLRSLLLRQLNFERALEEVRSREDTFTTPMRKAMGDAVRDAFVLQDRNICHELSRGVPNSWETFTQTLVRPLVGRDQQRPKETSFFFTLNQDLLFERGFNRPAQDSLNLPGVPAWDGVWFPPAAGQRVRDEFGPQHVVTISRDLPAALQLRTRLNYVKLHGSFNWTDGQEEVMIVGGGKKEAVSRFPLLQAYFDLFRQVLCSGDMRLLVVGYSFRDDHVNEIVAEAVRANQLRLMIVDPRSADDVRNELLLGEFGDIWPGVVDFVSRPLAQIFETAPSTILSGEVHRFRRSFLDFGSSTGSS